MPFLEEAAINEEWAAALSDADLDPSACQLMCLTAADGPTAGHYPPGRTLCADELIDEDVAAALNRPENIDRHRIVVLRDVPAGDVGRALFAAKLRHELEHARQWNFLGDVPQRLSYIVDEIIDAVAGGFNDVGRAIYRAQPNERDANAAASRFVRGRFSPETLDAVAGDDVALVASDTPPEPIGTLLSRNVKFLLQYTGICATLMAGFGSFAERLAEIAPAARDLWLELESQRQRERAASRGDPGP